MGRNLTQEVAEGRVDPVVGRDHEIEQVLDVLARRWANNPILVGPVGVGKNRHRRGAWRVSCSTRTTTSGGSWWRSPRSALVSGTGVRGALAEKLARLRKEVKASEGRVLLFIDEIHALDRGWRRTGRSRE